MVANVRKAKRICLGCYYAVRNSPLSDGGDARPGCCSFIVGLELPNDEQDILSNINTYVRNDRCKIASSAEKAL
jgi:hypothetical protein